MILVSIRVRVRDCNNDGDVNYDSNRLRVLCLNSMKQCIGKRDGPFLRTFERENADRACLIYFLAKYTYVTHRLLSSPSLNACQI